MKKSKTCTKTILKERRYSSQVDLSQVTLMRQNSVPEKKPVLNYEVEMRMLGSGINRKPLKPSTSLDDPSEPRVNSQLQARIEARKKEW